jgi:hypothetical protein
LLIHSLKMLQVTLLDSFVVHVTDEWYDLVYVHA